MTATDELRRLLNERGVEWWPMHDTENGYHEDRDTEFLVWGCKHVAHEWGCRLQVDMLTPTQAVEATLGRDRYSYEQFREISDAVGDAMQYAHDKAIEHPDAADPLWNLDEYVNRILKVAFEGEATLGRGECEMRLRDDIRGSAYTDTYECSECGEQIERGTVMGESEPPRFCPNCGRKVKQ